MAEIDVVRTGHVSVLVQITGLTESYSYNDRVIDWYVDGDYWDSQDLAAKVASSELFELRDLDPDTDYDIYAIIDGDEGMTSAVTLATVSASTRVAKLSLVEKSSNSITVSFVNANARLTYYFRIYNTKTGDYVKEALELTFKEIDNEYTIKNLNSNTKYAINVGYIYKNEKDEYDSDITWIYPSGKVLEVTTDKEAAILRAEVYIQNANGTYSTSANYTYSYDVWVGEDYDIQDFADTIYDGNLDNSMSSTTNSKLHANLEFDYMTATKGGTKYTSGDISILKSGTTTVYYYFNRLTYYMTLAATTGVNNFTINNVSFNTGQKLSFLYGQSINAKANLSSNYEFTKWTANPTTITDAHNKTSNPLTFTMPASNFTITANATYKVVYYDVKLYCYYENADNGGVSGGLVDTLSYASGTSFVVSDYKNTYLKTGFYFSMAQDGDTNAIGSSITITEDIDIEFYYKRNVWVLTLKGGTGVSSFTVNGNTGYASGSTLSYKYEQTVKIQAIFTSNYGLDYWSSSQISGLSGNPITIKMPNQAVTITAYAKIGIADWEWTSAEIAAFTGKGKFSTLTASRWNEFLDWCNEVLVYKGKATIGTAYYGTKGKPLYASDFNYIIDRLEAVATISSSISSAKSKGDIIKGSYFIDIANAMNNAI